MKKYFNLMQAAILVCSASVFTSCTHLHNKAYSQWEYALFLMMIYIILEVAIEFYFPIVTKAFNIIANPLLVLG